MADTELVKWLIKYGTQNLRKDDEYKKKTIVASSSRWEQPIDTKTVNRIQETEMTIKLCTVD